MTDRIPFNKPCMVGKELYYIAEAVLGRHTAGDGPFTRRCETLLCEAFEAPDILLTTSCTSALEIAAILCDVREGDEVILPSYTFVSTANAFHRRGAKLVFVDIRRDTLNLDESLLDAVANDRTKVVVPVHYAGVGCEMDVICDIAERHDALVVEDAAQGVNARYKERFLGTIGDLGAYSFHETKNFFCGEGGALLVNNETLRNRAEIIRDKGTDRNQFFRGQVDKYTWVDTGSSYVPSDILAAFLYAQLEHMQEITERRREIARSYRDLLRPLAEQGLVELPTVPNHCVTNWHMFHVLVRDLKTRQSLLAYLKQRGIIAVFHYQPLHTSPMGRALGGRKGTLPVTEELADRVVRLPFYFDLGELEQVDIVRNMFDFFGVVVGRP